MRNGPDARVLAGGTDLIIRLRDGTLRPAVVVDLKRIAELQPGIREEAGCLVISATTVMTDVAADDRVRRHFAALAEAAAVVGSVQIRNRATLAGNICNASPAADTAPPLLVYGAILRGGGPGRDPAPAARRLLRPLGCHHPRARRARDRDRAAAARPARWAPSTFAARDGAATTSPRSPCAARWTRPGVTRLAYGSVGPRPVLVVDESGVLADPAAPDAGEGRHLRADVRRRQPIPALDAGRTRVPPGDAAGPRPAGAGRPRSSGWPGGSDGHDRDGSPSRSPSTGVAGRSTSSSTRPFSTSCATTSSSPARRSAASSASAARAR